MKRRILLIVSFVIQNFAVKDDQNSILGGNMKRKIWKQINKAYYKTELSVLDYSGVHVLE